MQSGYSQGMLLFSPGFQEWSTKRGVKIPYCSQRRKSSREGMGPAKPPMSAPKKEKPVSAMVMACLWL